MKTNKSFTKRLKVTKNGKILGRKAGRDHYNAKESSRRTKFGKKGLIPVEYISNKDKSRFLPGLKVAHRTAHK